MRVATHADDEAALVDVLIDEVQLGVTGRTLLAIFGAGMAALRAGDFAVQRSALGYSLGFGVSRGLLGSVISDRSESPK